MCTEIDITSKVTSILHVSPSERDELLGGPVNEHTDTVTFNTSHVYIYIYGLDDTYESHSHSKPLYIIKKLICT